MLKKLMGLFSGREAPPAVMSDVGVWLWPGQIKDIAPLPNGGFVACGVEGSGVLPAPKGWVARFDKDGAMLWKTTPAGNRGECLAALGSVVPAPDGGVVAAGSAAGADPDLLEAWVIRLDSHGAEVWRKELRWKPHAVARSAVVLADGGVAVAGYGWPERGARPEVWAARLTGRGDLLWTRSYRGRWIEDRLILCAAPPSSGSGMALAGTVLTTAGDVRLDARVLRLDGDGDVLWGKDFDENYDMAATSLAALPDGRFVFAGFLHYGVGQAEGDTARVVCLDGRGRVLWDRLFPKGQVGVANALAATPGGGVAVGGYRARSTKDWDAQAFELGPDGERLWGLDFRGGDKVNFVHGVARLADGGLVVGGQTSAKGVMGNEAWKKLDAWFARFTAEDVAEARDKR